MLRKFVCAAVLGVFCLGVAFADEFSAIITKVEGNKITFAKTKRVGKKFEKEDEQTLPVVKDVKVVTAKRNRETKKVEAGDALEGGLKNKRFTTIDEKGVRATIVTDADNKKITEIRVFSPRGKKKKDNQ